MSEKRKVLGDHKRVGKRLIPPLMQLPNISTVSFRDERIPDVLWISALMLRGNPRDAVKTIMDFVQIGTDVVTRGEVGSLAYLGNFALLNDEERAEIRRRAVEQKLADDLRYRLEHQRSVLDRYPLEFMFTDQDKTPRERAVTRLREDVAELLDRYSDHATKVQVTAVVAQMASGKIRITRNISVPDFNAIFTQPDSNDARRAASFARSAINAGVGTAMGSSESHWTRDFWQQAFALGRCEAV